MTHVAAAEHGSTRAMRRTTAPGKIHIITVAEGLALNSGRFGLDDGTVRSRPPTYWAKVRDWGVADLLAIRRQTEPIPQFARPSRVILRSEAHLEASRKAQVFVREAPRARRSRIGWVIFWGLILLNEIRGAYVVKQAWQAMFG